MERRRRRDRRGHLAPRPAPLALDALPPWLPTCHRAPDAVFVTLLGDLAPTAGAIEGKLRLVRADTDGRQTSLPVDDHFLHRDGCASDLQLHVSDLDGDGTSELAWRYVPPCAPDAPPRSRLVTRVGLGLVDHPAVAGLTPYEVTGVDADGHPEVQLELYRLRDATVPPDAALLHARRTLAGDFAIDADEARRLCPVDPVPIDADTTRGPALLHAITCAWLYGQPAVLLQPLLGAVCHGDADPGCQAHACDDAPHSLCGATVALRAWLRRTPPVRLTHPGAEP